VTVLLATFIGFRLLTGKSTRVETSDAETIELVDVHKVRLRGETEAEALLERAHEVERRGNHQLAHRLLIRLTNAYPETRAAEAARAALGRSAQKRSHFPDGPPTVPSVAGATAGETPAPARIAAGGGASGGNDSRAPEVRAPPPSVAANPEAALAASIPPATPRPESVTSNASGANPSAVEPAPSPPARTLPSGFQARSGVRIDPSGWPLEIVTNRDGAMMVLVRGGPYLMGRDGGDMTESPAHLARVSTFYIDKHEVTNRQFELFLRETGARPDRSQALAREGGLVSVSEDFPVVMVSARDARDYADWVGKRVPTEAQWEKAARGTDQRLFPWGGQPPVWVRPRAPQQIDAVMSYPNDLSPVGAYDMAGNTAEWTRDWYDPAAYAAYRGTTAEDPTGPSSRPPSSLMAVRGGSPQWFITAREGLLEGSRLPYLGFRCVLAVEGPDSLGRPATADPARPGTNPGGTAKKGPVPF
jgi:formylglycine-generating enzyme required for sulfatase activity